MIVDSILLTKMILLVIGSVTTVFGTGYLVLTKFAPPTVNKKDMILVSTVLLFVAIASFIISFTIL